MSIGVQSSHGPAAGTGSAPLAVLSLAALFLLIALATLWAARTLDPDAREQAYALYLTT